MSDLYRLTWTLKGSRFGGDGMWSNHHPRSWFEDEARRLNRMFPDLLCVGGET